MANLEANFNGPGDINPYLASELKRTINSIKGRRKNPAYKDLVVEIAREINEVNMPTVPVSGTSATRLEFLDIEQPPVSLSPPTASCSFDSPPRRLTRRAARMLASIQEAIVPPIVTAGSHTSCRSNARNPEPAPVTISVEPAKLAAPACPNISGDFILTACWSISKQPPITWTCRASRNSGRGVRRNGCFSLTKCSRGKNEVQ